MKMGTGLEDNVATCTAQIASAVETSRPALCLIGSMLLNG